MCADINAKSVHAGDSWQLWPQSFPGEQPHTDGLQMDDAVCVLPHGHSTWLMLRHYFSASLETSLPLFLHHLTSQAVQQMAAMASQTATIYLHAWRERGLRDRVLIFLISEDNWPISGWSNMTIINYFLWVISMTVQSLDLSLLTGK